MSERMNDDFDFDDLTHFADSNEPESTEDNWEESQTSCNDDSQNKEATPDDTTADGPKHRLPAGLAAKKKDENRKFMLILAAMSFLLLIGVGLILYPTIADAWNRHVANRAISSYVQAVDTTSSEQRQAELEKAQAYNESLIGQGITRFLPTSSEKETYNSLLDVTGTGIMGYITIPKIKVRMPIYHGTDEGVLQIASGHLEGSSLPIGGPSTHTVLTGHTGLPSAMLFTDIDTLEEGDKFTITVYDEVLTYEVESTHVVLPDNVDNLAIEPDRDLASLVTCTPYGVNTHRLIVTGHRIPTPVADENTPYKDVGLTQDLLITGVIIAVVIASIGVVFFVQTRRRHPSQHARH